MHAYLIGTYRKSIRQQQPGSAIITKDVSLTCMRMLDPAPGWLEIVEIPTFNLYEVIAGNDEHIDKEYARFIQLFNNKWICRYPRPQKVVFDNVSKYKRDFTPLLNDFDIKPVSTTIKNPQANAMVEQGSVPTIIFSSC